MIPHMANFLIKNVTHPKQTILDPFCGSGSVVIQSILEGRNAIGVDINPLAVLFSKAKVTPLEIENLEKQLNQLFSEFHTCNNPFEYTFPNADYWFTPATLRKLGAIKRVLEDNLYKFDEGYSIFWKALFVSIIRYCSRADTRGPKPFISKRAHKNRKGKHFDPFKIFSTQARLWISWEAEYQSKLKKQKKIPQFKIFQNDSRNLSHFLGDEKIDAIITSPPYLNAQDYYRSSKLQLFFLNELCDSEMITLSREIIGSDRLIQSQFTNNSKLPYPMAEDFRLKLLDLNKQKSIVYYKYFLDMSKVIKESNKLLESGSYFSIVIADNKISNLDIPTHKIINEIAEDEGFHLVSIYSDKIRDRRLPIKRNGHNSFMKTENLLTFEKN